MKDKRSYLPEDSMLDLVRNDSELILVIGRFGLSLGFGEMTVHEVCCQHDVDDLTFLTVVNYITGRDYNCDAVSLPSLIRYLKLLRCQIEAYPRFHQPRAIRLIR